jgi:hypothetical protein
MKSYFTPSEQAIIDCLTYHDNRGIGIVKNDDINEFLIARLDKKRVTMNIRQMIASLRSKGVWQIIGCGKGYYWSESPIDFEIWCKSYQSKINSMQQVLSDTKNQFNLTNK